jgi:hypothetical protein
MIHEALVIKLRADATVTAITNDIRPIQPDPDDSAPVIYYEESGGGQDEFSSAGYADCSSTTFEVTSVGTTYDQAARLDKAVWEALRNLSGVTVAVSDGNVRIRSLRSEPPRDIPDLGKLGRAKGSRARVRTFTVVYKPS